MANAYQIIIARGAQKELANLDRPTLNRIAPKIDTLADDPRPAGCRKLVDQVNIWRVRVGDWRVLYEVDDQARVVRILAVRHRSKAYE